MGVDSAEGGWIARPSIPFNQAVDQAAAIMGIMNAHVLGQAHNIRIFCANLLAGNHTSISGVPGEGKTRMAETAGYVLDLDTKRIQYTSDLMPSLIQGVQVLEEDQQKRDGLSHWVFKPGPLLTANIVIADEITRGPENTHSVTLEPMAEGQVSIPGRPTQSVQTPFFVFATMNPADDDPTLRPLTQAQVDRFGVGLHFDILDDDNALALLRSSDRFRGNQDLKLIRPVLKKIEEGDPLRKQGIVHELQQLQNAAEGVTVSETVLKFIIAVRRDLTLREETPHNKNLREHFKMTVGPSRGVASLYSLSRALALMDGDASVKPRHVREAIPHVFNHRLTQINYKSPSSSEALAAYALKR